MVGCDLWFSTRWGVEQQVQVTVTGEAGRKSWWLPHPGLVAAGAWKGMNWERSERAEPVGVEECEVKCELNEKNYWNLTQNCLLVCVRHNGDQEQSDTVVPSFPLRHVKPAEPPASSGTSSNDGQHSGLAAGAGGRAPTSSARPAGPDWAADAGATKLFGSVWGRCESAPSGRAGTLPRRPSSPHGRNIDARGGKCLPKSDFRCLFVFLTSNIFNYIIK